MYLDTQLLFDFGYNGCLSKYIQSIGWQGLAQIFRWAIFFCRVLIQKHLSNTSHAVLFRLGGCRWLARLLRTLQG